MEVEDLETSVNPEYLSFLRYTYLSESLNGLLVKPTTLPGCEFLGLFAGTDFKQGSVICKYTGKILSTREALRLEDKSYLMRLGEQCYVDAKDTQNVLARFINDSVSPLGWNVCFDKRPDERCAYIIALRDIAIGEELFVDYGRWYWAGKSPTRAIFPRR